MTAATSPSTYMSLSLSLTAHIQQCHPRSSLKHLLLLLLLPLHTRQERAGVSCESAVIITEVHQLSPAGIPVQIQWVSHHYTQTLPPSHSHIELPMIATQSKTFIDFQLSNSTAQDSGDDDDLRFLSLKIFNPPDVNPSQVGLSQSLAKLQHLPTRDININNITYIPIRQKDFI
jgi:hypothetical protein